ncbi:MAG: ECF transporter S component [Clostridia bacterium]|nr:ECF transporter S component [Clostridia bacterium]
MMKSKSHQMILTMCVGAMLMAMNVVLSSSIFSIPVPGGHLYLNDIVICTAAILLDPITAFMVGGVGAFLGDLFFYPTPMFVSLVTHGVQAVVISLLSHRVLKKHPVVASGIGVTLGAIINVVGYSLGRAFLYSTPEYAWVKLPYQILQAGVGAVVGMLLVFVFGVKKLYDKTMKIPQNP